MRFIGQVELNPLLFGNTEGKMAYLFMTQDDESDANTWEADGGENAVVIQPGIVHVPCKPLKTGPTLYRMVERPDQILLSEEPCEFEVQLSFAEDPAFKSQDAVVEMEHSDRSQYLTDLGGNKLGGTPGFLQYDQFPDGMHLKLLLQLDSTSVPFFVNFGDAGIGYAFLSNDGRSGKFLWQCA